ncbi:MAG: ArsA family ATPase [Acidimicrobiaceae bacterium]|nr:ArsA family ATPase [Acidimicrobiaceae bacterium]
MSLDILRNSKVIICLGTGGVGKTTTAAAFGYMAAKAGRHVCVVTIDPARRLADAMGITELSNDPKKIDTSPELDLWAVMLDPNSTFDELVQKFANTPEQIETIFHNPIYQNLTENLSGTQEYMAMEKLHELSRDPRFDMLVVDTPPARNAIEFLNAPKRLTGFLENRVFRLLISPSPSVFRPVTLATRLLLRTISKVVGTQVVSDAVEFFQAFEGMEEGFKNRAAEVQGLLARDSTSFVLVTGTHKDTIDEALFFASRLEEFDLDVDLVVSNKVTPEFGGMPESELAKVPKEILENLRYLVKLRSAELEQLSRLSAIISSGHHILVPLLAHDVGSLSEIEEIGEVLVDSRSRYVNSVSL